MDLATTKIERDTPQRSHAGIVLYKAIELDERGASRVAS
jgi:hypothetical protein